MINDDSNIAMSMINLGDPTGDFVTLSPELCVFIYAFFKPITAPTELVSQAVPQVEFPHFTATNKFLPPDFSLCQDNADVWIFSLKLRPPLLGFGICAIQTQRRGDQLPLQPPYIKFPNLLFWVAAKAWQIYTLQHRWPSQRFRQWQVTVKASKTRAMSLRETSTKAEQTVPTECVSCIGETSKALQILAVVMWSYVMLSAIRFLYDFKSKTFWFVY